MKGRLIGSSSLVVLALAAMPAMAQTQPATKGDTRTQSGEQTPQVAGNEDIVVTATRRSESLQDVPLSVTAFSQAQLTRKGIVGFEGLARETPGVIVNEASANFNNFSARGISTNGYSAGLQTTVAIYLDDLPLSTIGNTVTLNPNLFDVQRVEFLRGPQGTLFGSGSLSGALRIITKSPELGKFDESALVDIGETPDGGSVRQRYNAMVNVPLGDTLALRVVGYYRNEGGWVDNIGTGVKNANKLVDWGGRATLLWRPNDRLDVKLLASYEDSDPTCVDAFCSVSSIVWMAFWPASKERSEPIISTIAVAGSVPEPSSAPERTAPGAWPLAWPVKLPSPTLRALLTA